jgi:hypothetical protein
MNIKITDFQIGVFLSVDLELGKFGHIEFYQ